jgi:Gpi18-like mannosyltransferase
MFAFCFETPLVTADVFRKLGYSSHFFEDPIGLYRTYTFEFEPEPWTNVWNKLPWIYLPGTTVFFAMFAELGLGIFWVKVFLTLCDFASSFVLYKLKQPLLAVLVLVLPQSVFYTSHEGQYESLLVLLLLLTLFSIRNKQWFLSGLVYFLAIQLKQGAIFFLPFVAYEILWGLDFDRIKRFFFGGFVAIIPFIPIYIHHPFLFFYPWMLRGGQKISSVYWDMFDVSRHNWIPTELLALNQIASYLSVAVFLVLVVLETRSKGLRGTAQTLPGLVFWCALKSLSVMQFWYFILVTPFLALIENRKHFVWLLVFLLLLSGSRSIRLLSSEPFGFQIGAYVRGQMERCMMVCDHK